MIDDGEKISKQAQPLRAAEVLAPIYGIVWNVVQTLTSKIKYHEPTNKYFSINGHLDVDPAASDAAQKAHPRGEWVPVYTWLPEGLAHQNAGVTPTPVTDLPAFIRQCGKDCGEELEGGDDSAIRRHQDVIPASRRGTRHLPPAGPPEAQASRATSATPLH